MAPESTRTSGGYREMTTLALPVVLSMLSQTLMWLTDTFFLGYLGPVAQGAAGLGGAFVWPLFVACNCSGVGVNIIVAQYVGARRLHQCGVVTWQGLYISLVAWLPMLLGGLYAQQLVQFSAPDPALVAPATLYLRIRLIGSLPSLGNFVLVSYFRGLGDTKTPLMVTLVTTGLNGLLDVLLIFGYAGVPPLTVAGSALATILATAIGSVIYLTLFVRRGRQQGLLARPVEPLAPEVCRRLLTLSLPVGLQKGLEVGAWSLFTALIARLGATEVAAHHIVNQVIALSYMSGYGVSIAATTMVGQYLGAHNLVAARRSMVTSLGLVAGLMGSLGLGFFLWRYPVMRLFTHDAAVVAIGVRLLLCAALFQIFDGLAMVSMAVLRGAGETRWPMVAGLLMNWGVFLPFVALVLLVFHGGVVGAWMMAVGSIMLLGVVTSHRVWRGNWQTR